MKEQWRQIPDFPYEASNLGRIRRLTTYRSHVAGNPKKVFVSPLGYMRVVLYRDNEQYNFFVHRCVWDAFNGAPPKGKQINHKNGDKTDNSLCNLEVVTQSENAKHAYRLGLQVSRRGERSHRAKLTEKQALTIKRAYAQGIKQRDLAARYGLSQGAISMLCTGINWSHLQEERRCES